jgi:hypothetical protein
MAPGSWVTHVSRGGFGMVVALTPEQMTVLWSDQPRHPDLFPNPPRDRQPLSMPKGSVFYLDYTYGGETPDSVK